MDKQTNQELENASSELNQAMCILWMLAQDLENERAGVANGALTLIEQAKDRLDKSLQASIA